MEFTPETITKLKKNEIFVFGSNESGIHGAGAAWFAEQKLGAKRFQGFGLAGQTFALPTKDWEIKQLPLSAIKFYIGRFVSFADSHPQYKFFVTKIGCGLAGFEVKDIAPLFTCFALPKNVILPKEFHDYLSDDTI